MLLSISSAALNLHKDINQKYYDLEKTVSVLEKVRKEFPIDGFELQLLEEWNPDFPPLADESPNRTKAWEASRKYTAREIIDAFSGLPILSIHANKDIGCLISHDGNKRIQGEKLIDEALMTAEDLSAEYCVFHIWDPWSRNVNVSQIQKTLAKFSSRREYITIEGIPTKDRDKTPFQIADNFEALTWDIRFSQMYKEDSSYLRTMGKVKNIHIHADLHGGEWILDNSGAGDGLGKTVREMIGKLPVGCRSIITLESVPEDSEWNDFKRAMGKLKKAIGQRDS